MPRQMHWSRGPILQALVHIGALVPLIILAWDFSQGQLTVNPIREIQLRTGRYALVLLILSLAVSPLSRLPGLRPLLSMRRTLGLYAFASASLHILNFIGLDYQFDLSLIAEDIFEKWYALFGLAAFLALLPLAMTSTRGWIRRLGKNWHRLHRLVYLAAILAIAHFVLQTRGDITKPLLFGGAVALLLVVRLPIVRRVAIRLSEGLKGPVR